MDNSIISKVAFCRCGVVVAMLHMNGGMRKINDTSSTKIVNNKRRVDFSLYY